MNNPTKAARSSPTLDVDDLVEAMAGVLKLPPDPRGRAPVAPIAAPPRKAAPADDGDGVEWSYVAPGVDRRELRKMKRGEYAPATRLDLHGQTVVEAVANVKHLIDTRRRRDRCVCIVHGRGLHSNGNVSILKTRVRESLRRHPAVLAYADAPRNDGGGGAVYVLLRG